MSIEDLLLFQKFNIKGYDFERGEIKPQNGLKKPEWTKSPDSPQKLEI
jgi:hypothetical protein